MDRVDAVEGLVERRREAIVHRSRVLTVEAARDEERLPPIAAKEVEELVFGNPCEHGRVRDLVAVQVQDREHGAVDPRVQELVRVPARSEWPRFRFAVSDDTGDEQVGIVERRPERVRERVAELAALVNGAGRLGSGVARDTAGKRELPEELSHAVDVLADVGIELAVRALEVGVGDVRGPTVAGTRDEDRDQLCVHESPGSDVRR